MCPGFAVVWTKIKFAFSCSSDYCSLLTQYGILVTIGDGFSPFRCQAITWTKSDSLPSRSNRTRLNDILFEILKIVIQENALQNVVCKISKFRPFRSGLQMSIAAEKMQIPIDEIQSNAVNCVSYLKEINCEFCPRVP